MTNCKPKSVAQQPRRPETCFATPTVDELSRAEGGDPWALLLVGILRAVPSNNEMKLTRTEAFRFEDDSSDVPTLYRQTCDGQLIPTVVPKGRNL
jgi:hypothetical protein